VSLDLNRRTWGPQDHATADEQEKATKYVASIAYDADDCRHLLDVLGLLPKHLTAAHGMPGYRQGCHCETCRKANANRTQRQRAAVPTTTVADCPTNTTTGDLTP
jgi:hypothetical protein